MPGSKAAADAKPQLFNLQRDLAESKNVAEGNPDKVKELEELLKK